MCCIMAKVSLSIHGKASTDEASSISTVLHYHWELLSVSQTGQCFSVNIITRHCYVAVHFSFSKNAKEIYAYI